MKKCILSILFGCAISSAALASDSELSNFFVNNLTSSEIQVKVKTLLGVRNIYRMRPQSTAFLDAQGLIYTVKACRRDEGDEGEQCYDNVSCLFHTPSPAVVYISENSEGDLLLNCLPFPPGKASK